MGNSNTSRMKLMVTVLRIAAQKSGLPHIIWKYFRPTPSHSLKGLVRLCFLKAIKMPPVCGLKIGA